MNSDSYFEIGNSHLVCQDYALSGSFKDMHYGIVSDGCSSAEHSEIGAQVLCHVAQYNLHLHYDLFLEGVKQTLIMSLLGNSIIRRADEIRKLYPIGKGALQATLLIALVIQNKIWVFGWGDGYFIFTFKGEENKSASFIVKIEYPQTNGPFYLCTDRQAYIDKFGTEAIVRRTDICDYKAQAPSDYAFDTPYFSSSIVKPGDMITITTDGLGQYQDHQSPISDLTMVPSVLEYPSIKGAFVQRTMNFLKRDMIKRGRTHTDDVSVATIVI